MCGIPRLSHQPEYVRKPVFEPATIRRNNGQPSLPLFPSIPGIILQLPFSFPLVTHDARSDHQTIKYTEDLSRPSSTSLYDDFETGESFNYSYFWIISRILQVPFSFPLVIHERQIRSSDDKMHEDLSLPSTILKQVNLLTILIFWIIWIEHEARNVDRKWKHKVDIDLYNFNTNSRERGNHNEETNGFGQKNRIRIKTELY